MARDTNQRQLLQPIERNALLRRAERPLSAPHINWPTLRGALRLLYTPLTPSRGVPLARRPPPAAAGSAASPPLTRACLFLAYSEVHGDRPRERAPRPARARRAALARPSAAQTPSQVPSGRFVARDLPPCGARRKPEAAARVALARHSTFAVSSCLSRRHTCARRLREAPCASSIRTARPGVACLWRDGRPQPQPPRRLLYTGTPLSSWHRPIHSGRPLERAPVSLGLIASAG